MPVQHVIDDKKKLIITTWSGEAVESELMEALARYQKETKNFTNRHDYDELVDFSNTRSFKLSTVGLKNIAKMASATDAKEGSTKLAIIVSVPLAFGLGRVYEIYRSLVTRNAKKVGVFDNHQEAREWLEK